MITRWGRDPGVDHSRKRWRRLTPHAPAIAGSEAGERVYAVVMEAHGLTMRLRETPRVDSKSGDRYGSTVEVELDGKPYRECGQRLR